MPTKERILENKQAWIRALEATIRQYETKGILREIRSIHCPLCTLDDKIKGYFPVGCVECIHRSEFSQNKYCAYQVSMLPFLHNEATPRDVATRVRFLKNIIKRLNAAS